jgi:hypothetical protein
VKRKRRARPERRVSQRGTIHSPSPDQSDAKNCRGSRGVGFFAFDIAVQHDRILRAEGVDRGSIVCTARRQAAVGHLVLLVSVAPAREVLAYDRRRVPGASAAAGSSRPTHPSNPASVLARCSCLRFRRKQASKEAPESRRELEAAEAAAVAQMQVSAICHRRDVISSLARWPWYFPWYFSERI